MYKPEAPKQPSCEGMQFAVNPYDSHNYLDVHNAEFGNEMAMDRPMHDNTTPMEGGFNFSAGHYDDSPGMGGFGSYGVMVEDKGQNPSANASRESVEGSMHADRGKEA